MNDPIQPSKTIHSVRYSRIRPPLRRGFFLIALALASFGLLPKAQAADGGLPNFNTAEGDGALFNNTGFNNTAMGFNTLFSNTSGSDNTAIGSQALDNNTTGSSNTASGFLSLSSNTTGSFNTAMGLQALNSNTTGSANTALGLLALGSNTTGMNNTATGIDALLLNSTGSGNTASGFGVLENNETGSNQTATGFLALFSNTTGHTNTATGHKALFDNTTGSFNIALGSKAGQNLTTGSNNIDIGNPGVAGESGHIRIGAKATQTNTFIAGINGVTVAGGVGVVIDSHGHLGTVTSSERFKDEIKPMDKASEAILALQPVTFRYKHALDPENIPQFGLVAEQVEKVNPDLVARDEKGKAYTVRYEAVNAMLLNEFLKEHKKVEELKATVAKQEAMIAQREKEFRSIAVQQEKEIQTLTASAKEQASQLRKVSDQLEVNKPAPQLVAGNQ